MWLCRRRLWRHRSVGQPRRRRSRRPTCSGGRRWRGLRAKAAQVAPAPKASPPRPPVAVLQPCTVNAIALVCAVRELSVLGPVKVRLEFAWSEYARHRSQHVGAARVRITLRWEVTGFLAAPWVELLSGAGQGLGCTATQGGTTGKASLLSHGGKLAIGIDGRESVVLEGDAAAWTEADGCGRTAGKGRIELSSLRAGSGRSRTRSSRRLSRLNALAGVVSILGQPRCRARHWRPQRARRHARPLAFQVRRRAPRGMPRPFGP